MSKGIVTDIREFRKLTQELGKWARELDALTQAQAQAQTQQEMPRAIPMLPLDDQYAYIVCKVCHSPAILLRDRKNPTGVAVACMMCRDIAALPEGLRNYKLQ